VAGRLPFSNFGVWLVSVLIVLIAMMVCVSQVGSSEFGSMNLELNINSIDDSPECMWVWDQQFHPHQQEVFDDSSSFVLYCSWFSPVRMLIALF